MTTSHPAPSLSCTACGARTATDCPERTIALKRCLYVAELEAQRQDNDAPKLCVDCGCEADCIQWGCAKRYDEVRNKALEDAAQVSDEIAEKHNRSDYSSYSNPKEARRIHIGVYCAAGMCAAAIRALKKDAQSAHIPERKSE